MNRIQLAIGLLVISVGRLTMYAVGKPSAGVANRVWLLAMGALAAWAILRQLDDAASRPRLSEFDVAGRGNRNAPDRPTRLNALEDLAVFAATSAYGAHHHFRPYLREIVADRLAARGIDLDTDPRARALAGAAGWELLRPDRPDPASRGIPAEAPGLDAATMSDLLGLLSALDDPSRTSSLTSPPTTTPTNQEP